MHAGFLVFLGVIGNRTQGLMLARQVLYLLSYNSNLSIFILFFSEWVSLSRILLEYFPQGSSLLIIWFLWLLRSTDVPLCWGDSFLKLSSLASLCGFWSPSWPRLPFFLVFENL
jgi:hypothetical protein